MADYTTVSGDTWDLIAKKTLGNEYLMTQLIDANYSYRETVIFKAGTVLTIPDAVDDSTADLPPWLVSS